MMAAPQTSSIDPASALSCPGCRARATPGPSAQRCGNCGRRFSLHIGFALDPSVPVPAHDRRLPTIRAKSSSLKSVVISPDGILEAQLDPVVGLLPLEQSGVLFPDVASIAIWRRIDWVQLIVGVLVPLPIAMICTLATAVGAPWPVLLVGTVFGALAAFMIYRAVVVRAHHARIVGRWRTLTIRFDAPFWNRRAFHRELLRRAGAGEAEIP
jgi:hypothetical protein